MERFKWLLVFCGTIAMLGSCNSKNGNEEDKTSTPDQNSVEQNSQLDSGKTFTTEQSEYVDTGRAGSTEIQKPDSLIPLFPSEEIKMTKNILIPGFYHGEEVWASASKDQWLGLYHVGYGYEIKSPDSMQFSRVFDGIMDEEGDSTGCDVRIADKNDCIMLFANMDKKLKKGLITTGKTPYKPLIPGDTFKFYLNNKKYLITVDGYAGKGESGEDVILNYEMELHRLNGRDWVKQKLFAAPGFDDVLPKILFIGDLNDDGLADIILEASHHYNVSRPLLYLSTPSDTKLVNLEGAHWSTGC